MSFVITQRCCNDASCVTECPVDCIRPRPDDPEYATTEMLYIDPDTCIDCGACVDACPVGAIYSDYDLPASYERYLDINRGYFERYPLEFDPEVAAPSAPRRLPEELGTLRVAIVGSGPAGCYAAEQLLRHGTVEVEIFDRLATPWGLVRAGVAPDHPETKRVADGFAVAFKTDALRFHLNVEVGKHISLDELRAHHHAVIFAVGASSDRRLDIPGEDLPGSHPATEFVAWYNGHPDHADLRVDLSGERAVIVGNGNVALDVARVLTLAPDDLATTDIADHALEALRNSGIREVVVLGRRGPAQAAYTSSEFLALGDLPGVDVVIEDEVPDVESDVEPAVALKTELAQEYAATPASGASRRIVFRYLASPVEYRGSDRVESVEIVHNELDDHLSAVPTDRTETLDASLVLRSVGYRGEPIADLPFDHARGVVPNEQGRVVDVPGLYVTGWIKRGPRGVIGTNRVDSAETVAAVLADFESGALPGPDGDGEDLLDLVTQRQPAVVDKAGWAEIDAAERAAGAAVGRPRIKRVR
ncbi:MAG TPA: FAD-dependent oxidoreductase [Aldersonia sp.]